MRDQTFPMIGIRLINAIQLDLFLSCQRLNWMASPTHTQSPNQNKLKAIAAASERSGPSMMLLMIGMESMIAAFRSIDPIQNVERVTRPLNENISLVIDINFG